MTVYTVPSIIPADDGTPATEVSAAIQAWIDHTVPDGTSGNISEIRLPASYRCDATILLNFRNWITVNGQGHYITTDVIAPYTVVQTGPTTFQERGPGGAVVATFTTSASATAAANDDNLHRAGFDVVGSSNVRITRVTYSGANAVASTGTQVQTAAYNPLYESQHGVRILGSAVVAVDQCTFGNVGGDYVYASVNGTTLSTAVWIHDNNMNGGNGRQGVSLLGVDGATVERNLISRVRMSTIDLEPNGASNTTRFVTIRANQVGPQRLAFVTCTGSNAALVSDITIGGDSPADGNVAYTDPGYTSSFDLNKGRMNCVFTGPTTGTRRARLKFKYNDFSAGEAYGTGSGSGTQSSVNEWDTVDWEFNACPLQSGRGMTGVTLTDCSGVTVGGNSYPGGINEFLLVNSTLPRTFVLPDVAGLRDSVSAKTATYRRDIGVSTRQSLVTTGSGGFTTADIYTDELGNAYVDENGVEYQVGV